MVRRLHDGAQDTRGASSNPPSPVNGDPNSTGRCFVPAWGSMSSARNFALSCLRYLADPNNSNPAYQLTDLKFTVESFWRMVLSSSTCLPAMDPDLGAFRRGGGKLRLWNDQHISPQSTLAYYDAPRVDGKARGRQFRQAPSFSGSRALWWWRRAEHFRYPHPGDGVGGEWEATRPYRRVERHHRADPPGVPVSGGRPLRRLGQHRRRGELRLVHPPPTRFRTTTCGSAKRCTLTDTRPGPGPWTGNSSSGPSRLHRLAGEGRVRRPDPSRSAHAR